MALFERQRRCLISFWFPALVIFSIMKSARANFGEPQFPPYEHQEAVTNLSKSQNKFTWDMYTKLAKESSGNLFFSPFSIMTALGMTLAGARGNTKSEMCKVLHLAEDDEEVHNAFSDVVKDIKKEAAEYELRTANMAYVSNQLNILEDYVSMLTGKYLSSAEVVNFSEEATARNKINGAVEKETNSRIKDLIPPGILNSLTRLVLVNAVYFKGFWEHQFNENNTKDQDFWISATESVKIPMMNIKKQFGYFISKELGATLLKMNYQGSRLSMVFVLPDARDGLADVEAKLANVDLAEIDMKMRSIEIEVTIPKFKLEESLDLGDHLSGMGIKDLFSDSTCDLTGISAEEGLYVSKVLHKAFLEVNEKGSEAAAATGAVMMMRSMPIAPPEFVADHPFLLYIRDQASRLVLFAGKLATPKQSSPRDEL